VWSVSGAASRPLHQGESGYHVCPQTSISWLGRREVQAWLIWAPWSVPATSRDASFLPCFREMVWLSRLGPRGRKSSAPNLLLHQSLRLSQSGFLFLHKHHDQEASWGGKGLFSLHFHIAVHHHRKSGQEFTQGRNSEAGADAEAMEGCYLLASPGLLILLSYRTQDYQPSYQGWSHPQWPSHPWSLIEKMSYSQISWRHFLKGGSFLCDNSSCVKLTHKTSECSVLAVSLIPDAPLLHPIPYVFCTWCSVFQWLLLPTHTQMSSSRAACHVWIGCIIEVKHPRLNCKFSPLHLIPEISNNLDGGPRLQMGGLKLRDEWNGSSCSLHIVVIELGFRRRRVCSQTAALNSLTLRGSDFTF